MELWNRRVLVKQEGQTGGRKRTRRPPELYVNNKEFSQVVAKHVDAVNRAEAKGESIPIVPHYVADCFLRISTGLARSWKFNRYTYKEEMIMDGVENCLRYITRFSTDPSKTASGALNAFAYFTQICHHAFLQRIKRENKQRDIKFKMMQQGGIADHFGGMEETNDVEYGMMSALDNHLAEVKLNASRAFSADSEN